MFTSIIKRVLFLIVFVLLQNFALIAQSSVLDNYISEAFLNNEGLKQKELNLERALYALQEAKSYYLPEVSFNAVYTKANGGRTIDLPIGDLLNPVYSTLNTLTASKNFPEIENQSVLLNPDNFYDAKLHASLPLVNMEIGFNKRIKKEDISYHKAAINVYKRELVKNIKTAYYQYYQAIKAVEIYQSSLNLVKENTRVNESLLRNGARNATALIRSQAEEQKVMADQEQQQNRAKNAKAYFNFLLNKNLEAAIELDSTSFEIATGQNPLTPVALREELQQVKIMHNKQELYSDMLRNNKVPKLSAFLDAGSQAFNFNINSKSLYYLGGLSLQWNLFAGNRNNYKIKQAEKDVEASDALLRETEHTFALQEEQSRNDLNTALKHYNNAITQLTLAERYYNDQFKVYKEGQLLYIELIDAQNELTGSRLKRIMAEAEIQIALAGLERNQATYPL